MCMYMYINIYINKCTYYIHIYVFMYVNIHVQEEIEGAPVANFNYICIYI